MDEKQNDICPKCSKLLDSEGLCWHCMTKEYNQTKAIVDGMIEEGINSYASMLGYKIEAGKLNRLGKKLGYGVYNDMRGKKPKTND